MKKLLNIALVLSFLMTGSLVSGQELALAQRVVEHHLAASENANIAEVMSDYAEDAILILDGTLIKGKAAIRQAFEQLLLGPPPSPLTVTRSGYDDNVGFILWTMDDGTKGTDTFVLENEKIIIQTVALFPDN